MTPNCNSLRVAVFSSMYADILKELHLMIVCPFRSPPVGEGIRGAFRIRSARGACPLRGKGACPVAHNLPESVARDARYGAIFRLCCARRPHRTRVRRHGRPATARAKSGRLSDPRASGFHTSGDGLPPMNVGGSLFY
jgi:hypothetical protein